MANAMKWKSATGDIQSVIPGLKHDQIQDIRYQFPDTQHTCSRQKKQRTTSFGSPKMSARIFRTDQVAVVEFFLGGIGTPLGAYPGT
jgi:hypothetical protein